MNLIAPFGTCILMMITTPAFAQSSTDATQTRVIHSADLDLSSRNGVRTFNHRMNIAIKDVCGSASTIDLEGALRVTNCRHDLTVRTKLDLSRVIAAAQQNTNRPATQTADNGKLPSATMPTSATQR